MAEPEAESISRGPTPEPPQEASEVARRIQKDSNDKPVPEKAKTVTRELDREVSGMYEAKQEREAGRGRPKPVAPKTTEPDRR
jgi:hypothetical protein